MPTPAVVTLMIHKLPMGENNLFAFITRRAAIRVLTQSLRIPVVITGDCVYREHNPPDAVFSDLRLLMDAYYLPG